MPKKVIHLTEGELTNVVRDAVKKVLFEQDENYPHLDDVFNLENIPIEVLDRGYVRYEPYNLGITYRHPLRRIAENTDFKGNIEKAKEIMLSTYPLSEEQFIILEGHNGMYAAILASLIENNVEIIEKAMLQLGFFRSKPTDDKLLADIKGRKWIDIRFEPTPSNDLTDYVRSNYKYLYHLSPSIFESKIRQNGLIPSNNNSEFKYFEPRVYVMKGSATKAAAQELANELYQQAKKKGYDNLSPQYSFYVIDVSKIDNNVRFYGDINEADGLFLTSPILPKAFSKIEHITAYDETQ